MNTHQVLSNISRHNPLLVRELRCLPELQAPVATSAKSAAEYIVNLSKDAPDAFDAMLQHMIAIGLAARRKYCVPLQAMLWLAQDENFNACRLLLDIMPPTPEKQNPHRNADTGMDALFDPADTHKARPDEDHYSLERLLDASWGAEPQLISDSQIRQVIKGITTSDEIEEYAFLTKRYDRNKLQKYIFQDFQRKRHIFAKDDWELIRKALLKSRWESFYTVSDRLNSPELINYYINHFIAYRKAPGSGPYFTFFEKKAQCTDAAYFSKYLLERAGYTTFIRSVKWSQDPWDGLHTVCGIVTAKDEYLLVADYTGINRLSGPFKAIEEVDLHMARDNKIIERQWGAYFPPRFY